MRAYIEGLLAENRLRVVEREVSGKHELAAVTQASQRESDAPILFRKVAGSRFPVVSNVFGSRPRLIDMIGGKDGYVERDGHVMSDEDLELRMNLGKEQS